MNRYAKSLLYAGLVSCVLALPSHAQVNSTSNATSVSGSASGASSRAAANSGASTNQQNINFNSPGDVRSNNTSTNNNREAVSYSGGTTNSTYVSGDQTLRAAPTVYAPPVSGGNPCSLGVSAGASFLGWGAAAGGSYVDADCANRQKIAMIHNAGYAGAAKELMCNDRDSYFAFRTAGQPCAYRAAFESNVPAQPVAPPPVAAPTPVQPITPTVQPRVTTVQPKQYVRCNPRAGIVDNCVSG